MKTNYANAFSSRKPNEENKQKHKKDEMELGGDGRVRWEE
jgi:hypothetical protein